MAIRLTESRLRQIIREETARIIREGETFALKPGTPMPKVGDRIPMSSVTRGMSDMEGPGAERARAAAAKNWEPKHGSYDIDDDDANADAVYYAWVTLGGMKGYDVDIYDLAEELGLSDPNMIRFDGTSLMRNGEFVVEM